jgi:hypothetical protein
MIHQEIDKDVTFSNDIYTVTKPLKKILLKKIKIQKKPLLYSFLGGMWYTKESFSLKQDISLPYPFSTYFTIKIPDKIINNICYRSLLYIKTPLMVLQFENSCVSIEFDPFIKINNQEIFPFISLEENDEFYIISFYLFSSFEIKKKDAAWLGFPKKETIELNFKKGDTFNFSVKTFEYKNWKEAVEHVFKKHISEDINIEKPEEIFKSAKNVLYRSYDDITGSFLQLPWRDTPGFTFSNASYSLTSYEAVRLNYFSKWSDEIKDEELKKWSEKLKQHFSNPVLYKKNPKTGKGIIWYNMTNLTKKGLTGYFYMDCGYSGYPGGQATIAYNILQFLEKHPDEKLKDLTKKSLEYLMSTQKTNGSWPMAIKQEGLMKFRPEKLSEYETHGGTAECASALLLGYKTFKDEKMKKAAINALSYLDDIYPICYNGLRDIGLNEPEAFSAVNIINAFIEAYETTKDKKYLKNAENYAYYILPWFYLFDTKGWPMKFDFHPISYSITPRLSPYETTWIVSTFLRLAKYNNKSFWEKLGKEAFKSAAKWISENGGLSEGVFPKDFTKMQSLPMEQTFATVELMNAAYNFIEDKKILFDKKPQKTDKSKKLHLLKTGDFLEIKNEKEIIARFNLKKCSLDYIKGQKLNKYGISFSFYGPYLLKSRVKRRIKKVLRGSIGKYLLSAPDAKYFIRGVCGPKPLKENKIDIFGKYVKSYKIVSLEKYQSTIEFLSDFHKITLKLSVYEDKEEVKIIIDSIEIKMLKHDLDCYKVLIPIIGAELKDFKHDKLFFEKIILKTKISSIVKTEEFAGVDKTLATNWTHGGIYIGNFEIIIIK